MVQLLVLLLVIPSHVSDGLFYGVIVNDVLGACAGGYARGQLDGYFGLDGPSYVIF